MDIRKKLMMGREELEENGAITIVVFGDSISHGALAMGEINYETVYWNILRRKINAIRNYVPVNVINSAIGGTCANTSLSRLDKQVLIHNPDLVIVCFGLNDVNGPLDEYRSALKEIFKRCIDFGTEVIFMTPNMLNTYVADDTAPQHRSYAKKMADVQNSGVMDDFMNAARETSLEMGVRVCDCYAKWVEISKTQDTTLLLANRINHPIPKMHELFADMLFNMIFEGNNHKSDKNDSTMYTNN